jgi:hypothetical protein
MLKVNDPTALACLGEMEGTAWVALQQQKQHAPHSFFVMLAAWNQKVEMGYEHDLDYPLSDFMHDAPGDGHILYGSGGWRRYAVRPDGEIVLLRESTTQEQCVKAESLGIRVWG